MLDLSSFRVGSRLLFFLAQHLEEAKLVEASSFPFYLFFLFPVFAELEVKKPVED